MRIAFIFLAVLLGALVLLYPVYINHFPLVYSDSGTYIDSGFRNYVPDDRPIIYGLFIRHCSLKETLFLSILAQALLVSSIIFLCCRTFAVTLAQTFKSYAVSICILTLCTGLPWITSWIMPDICTGLSFVMLLVLLFSPGNYSRAGIAALVICYYFTTLSHLSNILSQLALVGVLLLVLLFARKTFLGTLLPVRKTLLIILLVCSNYLLLPLINYSFGGGFKMSNGGPVFLTSKLCGYGLLKDYLDHHCDEGQYKLCTYKDSLPGSTPEFLWDYSGPLYKTGGWAAENSRELSKLDMAILKEPQYLKVFVKNGLGGAIDQLTMFNVGYDFLPYDSTSPPFGAISWHLKKDVPFFNQSGQTHGAIGFNLNLLNYVQFYTVFLCLGIAILLMFLGPIQRIDLAIPGLLVLTLGNAIACAFFGDASHRYELRIVWIVILLTVIQVFVKREQIAAKLKRRVIH